jgi:hypothetical protein
MVLLIIKDTRAQLPVVMCFTFKVFLIWLKRFSSIDTNAYVIDRFIVYESFEDVEFYLSFYSRTVDKVLLTYYETKSPPWPSNTPKKYPLGFSNA